MRKKLERIAKVGSFVAGGVAVGVGLYYNMSLITGAGLAVIVYPIGTALGKMIDENTKNYSEKK